VVKVNVLSLGKQEPGWEVLRQGKTEEVARQIMKFGGPKISSVQVVFRSGTTLSEGERHGELIGTETMATAKPGHERSQ